MEEESPVIEIESDEDVDNSPVKSKPKNQESRSRFDGKFVFI